MFILLIKLKITKFFENCDKIPYSNGRNEKNY